MTDTQIETLESVLGPAGVYVFSDYIPESSVLPAVSVSNVSFPSGRILTGRKTRQQEVWRISVVAADKDTLYSTRDVVLSLDNSSNEHYQRIFVDMVNEEAKQEGEPNRRLFIDMTCTI